MILAAIIILCILAAACNAIMDTCETYISFKASKLYGKWDIMFWCKPVAADHKRFFWVTQYRVDGWHLMKSTMIILNTVAMALLPLISYTGSWPLWAQVSSVVILLGFLWNTVFNTLFNYLKTRQ